MTFEGFH
jgi:hypothetical protein